jgi:hypothetical protein
LTLAAPFSLIGDKKLFHLSRRDGERSKFEYRAILGNEHAGGADLVERAHVGQHDPAGAQIGQPGLEHLPAEVARHMTGIAVALDYEEIRSPENLHENS